jgi:hypothetical protein
MDYNKISDIFDIENEKIEIIQNNNKIQIIKLVKYVDIGCGIKFPILSIEYYNYLLFKTKYNNLYFDDTKIYNNLLIDTHNNSKHTDKFIIIKHKSKSSDKSNDKLESYYNQKMKLEIYFFKFINIIINFKMWTITYRNTLFDSLFRRCIFIKYIQISQHFDKKYITCTDQNLIMIYKVESYIKNQYNLYLYKIKNIDTENEILIDIDYDDIVNLFDNFIKYDDLIKKFIDTFCKNKNIIITDSLENYFGNKLYYIMCEKYLEMQMLLPIFDELIY